MSLSCFDPRFGERMLSVDEALSVLGESLAGVMRTPRSERVALAQAPGRVLAETVISPLDVPAQTNAAMDGIALAQASLPDAASGEPLSDRGELSDHCELSVIGSSLAGHPWTGRALAAGEAMRITTGAALPAGADTVVMQEQLEYRSAQGEGRAEGDAGERVVIEGVTSIRRGQNVRQAGEDIARGSQVMAPGQWLTPAAVGVLASLGLAEVAVYRPLTVAIFSTGDEVTAPGETLPAGGIYDANRFSLVALLRDQGIEVLDLGILSDDEASVSAALRDAATRADMVITSGGVSVGEADHVRSALAACGELALWRIAMRPGRPLAFGMLRATPADAESSSGQVPFFGLPGNPVATMVTFLQFVLPALRLLSGQQRLAKAEAGASATTLAQWQAPRLQLIAGETLRSRAERVDYHRGQIVLDDQGRQVVMTTGRQGSGILTSMLLAECLIEIPAGCATLHAGEPVMVQWLGSRGIV
ncbi:MULTISPECIES: gephyrin-like molybdotransferase Glp [unclassified Cobetia]|uniref:molybdopterin molybdotransferase MoeA n=1 Tax=unclassified Cobetia TaxID=2609414 RepID=UPI00178CD050|nr:MULTISPECIES: gephyrin-like molybdotransferase Glp [unclassified Cobetia]MBE2167302.1 molybdopterin molybdenumtransferase MoeA [Cobetia sp. 2AS1]MDH2447253.1 molybdopterin-binding protein [Cobetia sp. 2AS]